jgi:hypothetical protein
MTPKPVRIGPNETFSVKIKIDEAFILQYIAWLLWGGKPLEAPELQPLNGVIFGMMREAGMKPWEHPEFLPHER